MIRSRLTTWLQETHRQDCMPTIQFLNQSISEPELYSIQFGLCNEAIGRRVKAQWASDEAVVTHRCHYCAYDIRTVRNILRRVCPD